MSDEKRELTTADIEPLKKIPVPERRKLLAEFLKQRGITITEFGKLAGLSGPILSQFERGDRNLSVEDWRRVLIAMHEIEKKKSAERKARFDELHAEWMKNIFTPFFNSLPIETEQQRIIEEDQSSVELSKLIGEQAGELQKELKPQIAQMSKEEIVKQYCELWASVQSKDARIAELERQIAAREQAE